MLRTIEIEEIKKITRHMDEYQKIDYIFTMAYCEAMENVKPFKRLKKTGENNDNN